MAIAHQCPWLCLWFFGKLFHLQLSVTFVQVIFNRVISVVLLHHILCSTPVPVLLLNLSQFHVRFMATLSEEEVRLCIFVHFLSSQR